jgi:hypothetical protein
LAITLLCLLGRDYSGSIATDSDQLIKEDPFYQEQIADYEVIEFRAMKFHPSLAALV